MKSLREKYLQQISHNDSRAQFLHDFVSTAYLLSMKDLLDRCFTNQHRAANFAEVVKSVTKATQGDVFSNPIISEKAKRLQIPLEDMRNFLLPVH